MARTAAGLGAWALTLVVGCAGPTAKASTESAAMDAATSGGFWARRVAFETQARGGGPSSRAGGPVEDPPGAQRARYRVAPELWAWVDPHALEAGGAKRPALVYFHGDFSIDAGDHRELEAFRAAGFVTMAPILRGENGSSGDFTLLFDELDDGIAAVRWLAEQPGVDPEHIYTFGHSVGGGLAALTSLVPELPVRATGSCGGIYVPETFVRWSKLESQRALVRFDPERREELELRTLGPNVASMQRPHRAYVGDEDRWFHANVEGVQALADAVGAPFSYEKVPGDHMASLEPCLEAFLAWVSSDADRASDAAGGDSGAHPSAGRKAQ